jgi:hypothetical protein
MRSKMNEMIKRPEYQPYYVKKDDKYPITYCNVAARDLIDQVYNSYSPGKGGLLHYDDYDLQVISRTISIRDLILCTPIPKYYDLVNTAINKGVLACLSLEEIINVVGSGEIVHLIRKNNEHEAVVYEAYTNTQGEIKLLVAQCGLKCDILPFDDPWAFADSKIGNEVLAVVYPLRRYSL